MPLLWISLAFLAGLILGETLPLDRRAWLALSASALLLWATLHKAPNRPPLLARLAWLGRVEPRLFVPPLLLAAALFGGAWWIARSAPELDPGHLARFNNRSPLRIEAVVVEPPDVRDQATLLTLEAATAAPLHADGAVGPAQPARGRLLANLPGRAAWQYGDRLVLEGQPTTPPENEAFSYRAYLARQDIYTYLTYPQVELLESGQGSPLLAAIYRLRDRAHAEIYHLFPAPEAPLLAGILLGIESGMPDSLDRAFQDTGTAHVIAISGFNIAILAQLFSSLFGRFLSRWWATLAAILAIAAYTILVGGAPSVTRAAIMGSLALVARQIGRRSTGANSLAFTAALMSLANPRLPWDASFQLSFGATLGLILYGERFQSGFTAWLSRRLPAERARAIAGPVGEYVLMTLAAQLLTLPVILFHFQRLSLSSLLANPLILPPQPLVMVLSGLAVLAGAISDPLAHLLAWLAWPLSAYTIRVVDTLARLPGGVLVLGEMSLGTVLLMYAAVLTPLVSPRFPAWLRLQMRPTALLAGMGLAAALVTRAALSAPDGRLHLTVFNLDGSPVMLVQAPGGERLLVNGGPSARLLDDALGRRFSPFDRRVDALVINSPEADAVRSLPTALERYPTRQVFWGCQPPEHREAGRLEDYIQGKPIDVHLLAEGEAIGLGPEVRVEVLASSETGSALFVRWRNFRALAPGGISPGQLQEEDTVNLSLLMLEARDLEKTTADAWMALAPQATIVTADESLAHNHTNWLVTRKQGWYAVTTDGTSMWVEKK